MIRNLSVRNYILIEKLDIDFNSGFSVITGETGSGKSMIIGAISLLLGKRADTDVLFSKDKKCVIEATFDITKLGLKDLFAENDVDYSDETIVRREILPEGKSRAFINDMPVTLAVLKTLTDNFLDLHSQHENLSLTTLPYRLRIVDSAAGTLPLFEEYKQQYAEYQLLESLLTKKKSELAKILRDIDYYRFQAQEIENAKLSSDDELEELEARASMLENAEEIKSVLYETTNLYDGGEYSVSALLKQMRSNLAKIGKNYKPAQELEQRLESSIIELSDINDTISLQLSQVEVNPQQLQLTNERIDLLMGLLAKHRASNIAELKQKYEEYRGYVDNSGNLEDEIADLEKQHSAKAKEVKAAAENLSKKRSASFKKTQEYINSMLHDLGMPHGVFEIGNEITEVSPNGIDNISFLFSANKAVAVQPIEKVASGGELSRLMLALKSLMANSMNIPTILFDEIDTGVSGEIAARMGKIMQRIAENVQVLSITHLPQVAAMGSEHFKVYKHTDDQRTISSIKKLSADERITEIASMMSGEKLTPEALENAKVLLGKIFGMRGLLNIIIFAIAMLLPCMVMGQDMVGKISGHVVDSIYEEPCAYAILTLENINKITYSDTSGYFAFDSIPLGKYTLTVKYLGYYDSEIEISTDTIYDELTIMLSPSIWGNTERDSIIVYTYRTDDPFSSPVAKLIPNPYRKVNVPRLIVKNKNFESALDTIIAHIGSKSNKKYYLLKIDKNKFITIYSLNTPINLNCVPNGVLKYNGRTFYVLGDYKYILKSEEKCGQENNETLIFEFSEEETNTIIGTLNIQNGAWK